MKRRLALAVAALTAALAAPDLASAQSILSRAVVIDGTISVGRERDLDFGDVVRNSVVTVPVNSNQSARWRVAGTTGAQVSLTFFLPSALTVGARSLPISFNNTAGGAAWLNLPLFASIFNPNVVQNSISGRLAPGRRGCGSAGPSPFLPRSRRGSTPPR